MVILIVDDSIEILHKVKRHLEMTFEGEIAIAQSAEQGIAFLSDDVDLILLDVVMLEKDGIATCREIKSNPVYADIPVMFITQNHSPEILEKAFLAGASDFIKKPFDKLELKARVRSLLRLSHEIKQRKQREQELERLSMVDGLTGVANRRYFDKTIEHEWKLALRHKHPLSLIMFDIDHFKKYNDIYGHQGGDQALKAVASVAADELKRPTDTIARYGGEEFAIILPNTNSAGAYMVAERIRKHIETIEICHEKFQLCSSVTVSFGVAEANNVNRCSIKQLIAETDKALYQAKHSGRNCTVVSNTCV